jgi:tetratricopeptide (TPR) repeat protein
MYEIADDYYEDGDYFLAIDYFYPVAKANELDANDRLKELAQQLYEEADTAYKRKNYEKAIENFAFLADYNYLDSKDMINKCRYNYALDFYNSKEYEKALDYFVDIEKYKDSLSLKKDCIYKLGVIYYNQEPVSSIEYFSKIPGFKNSNEILNSDNLILYGSWNVVELNGNAVLNTSFIFDGDGLFKTESTNIVGVAISTDYTPYSYKWDVNNYKAIMDGSEYNLTIKIVDKNNIFVTATHEDKQYEYKCARTETYLDMLANNKIEDITNEESLTLHQKLTLLIENYIELKTDGKYKINGLLTDINDTKTHLNNSIENELENEQNSQSESIE